MNCNQSKVVTDATLTTLPCSYFTGTNVTIRVVVIKGKYFQLIEDGEDF